MTPTGYAQRLLNPFRGAMPVIECQGADAITTDRAHCDSDLRDSGLVEDLANAPHVQTGDIRHGGWSDAGERRSGHQSMAT